MPRPHVTLSEAHIEWQPYIDWLATGMHMLAENNEISFLFEAKGKALSRILQLLPKGQGIVKNFSFPLYKGGSGTFGPIVKGNIKYQDKSVNFVYDMKDSPFDFNMQLLEQADLYFKCQCPITIDPEGFPINRKIRIPYDPKVIENQDKIRPAMLGRPLSCTHNLKKSAQLLAKLRTLAEIKKENRIFASFGSDKPPGKDSNSDFEVFEIIKRYSGLLEHPNIKRGKIVKFISDNLKDKTDVRIISSSDSTLQKAPLKADEFFRQVAGSVFDVNISGFRRSLTHRFATDLMLGTAVITDEIAVKWYQPFEKDVEIFDLGKLGYELHDACDWHEIYSRISEWHNNAEEIGPTIRGRILERFQDYWHPMSLGRYIIHECEHCI